MPPLTDREMLNRVLEDLADLRRTVDLNQNIVLMRIVSAKIGRIIDGTYGRFPEV